MSYRNLAIKGSEEIDKAFLKGFKKLCDYSTSSTKINEMTDNILERELEKVGKRIKADLAIVTAINESYFSPQGKVNKEVTFYRKWYHCDK